MYVFFFMLFELASTLSLSMVNSFVQVVTKKCCVGTSDIHWLQEVSVKFSSWIEFIDSWTELGALQITWSLDTQSRSCYVSSH